MRDSRYSGLFIYLVVIYWSGIILSMELAYKFKSDKDLDHVLEAILEDKLYCADWRDLNDPMEGYFSFWGDERELRQILSEKEKCRVCALSKTWREALLWCHYANGFRGLALAVNLTGLTNYSVAYEEYIPELDETLKPTNLSTTAWKARHILSHKLKYWKIEDEVRIIKTCTYVDVSVVGLLVGFRMPDPIKRTLIHLAEQKGIACFETRPNQPTSTLISDRFHEGEDSEIRRLIEFNGVDELKD